MSATAKKYERLDFRVTPDAKDLISRAASQAGQEVSEFVLSRIIPEARRILDDEQRIALRNKAWRQFMALVESPPKPNKRLIEAIRASAEHEES
jgi:uncharacterized protein (DUF1778 family)